MTARTSHAAWLLRRFVLAATVVVGVATLTFALIHLAPGDPIYVLAGDGGNDTTRRRGPMSGPSRRSRGWDEG